MFQDVNHFFNNLSIVSWGSFPCSRARAGQIGTFADVVLADAIVKNISGPLERSEAFPHGYDNQLLAMVNIQKAIENGHRNSGFSHEKW